MLGNFVKSMKHELFGYIELRFFFMNFSMDFFHLEGSGLVF